MLLELIVLCAIQPYSRIYRLTLPRNSRVYRLLRLCPAILLANKRVYYKASTLFYSRNRFKLDKGFLILFLDQIGPQNVSFLRHICIAFPAFNNHYYLKSVTLKKDSIRTLKRICDNCTNLITLKTLLHFRIINIIKSAINAPNSPQAATLALIDARFKAILLLKEIIINIYNKPISYNLREEMYGYRQTIKGI